MGLEEKDTWTSPVPWLASGEVSIHLWKVRNALPSSALSTSIKNFSFYFEDQCARFL